MTERFQGRLADVIRRPLITEKATRAQGRAYQIKKQSCHISIAVAAQTDS